MPARLCPEFTTEISIFHLRCKFGWHDLWEIPWPSTNEREMQSKASGEQRHLDWKIRKMCEQFPLVILQSSDRCIAQEVDPLHYKFYHSAKIVYHGGLTWRRVEAFLTSEEKTVCEHSHRAEFWYHFTLRATMKVKELQFCFPEHSAECGLRGIATRRGRAAAPGAEHRDAPSDTTDRTRHADEKDPMMLNPNCKTPRGTERKTTLLQLCDL